MSKKAKARVSAIDVRVGELIRAKRISLGVSQEELGKAVGISFQQIQKYEKGLNRVASGRLLQVAETLKVDPAFFFNGIGASSTDDEEITGLVAVSGAVDLLRAYKRLPSGCRFTVVSLLQEMADHLERR